MQLTVVHAPSTSFSCLLIAEHCDVPALLHDRAASTSLCLHMLFTCYSARVLIFIPNFIKISLVLAVVRNIPFSIYNISVNILNAIFLFPEPMFWFTSCQDLIWVRNHIMAPLSEEWVFRACMIPLLLQCLPPLAAVFVGPLLFGVGKYDLHHTFNKYSSKYSKYNF